MIPQWFEDLANQIDFQAIDPDTQKVFRDFMVKFASSNLPLKGESTIKSQGKLMKLRGLATIARMKK
jgi:hypothetical protein